MVALFYGRDIPLRHLRDQCHVDRQGTSLFSIGEAAKAIGLKVSAAKASFEAFAEARPFPAVVNWNRKHFVVCHDVDRKERVHVADPAYGATKITRAAFEKAWLDANGDGEGWLLLFEPTPAFYATDATAEETKSSRWRILRHLQPYQRFLWQIIGGLLIASVLQFTLPFLTQAVVDKAIAWNDATLLKVLLLGQLLLFAGRASSDVIRSWMLLHIGNRINIAMLSDFLARLSGLPLSYFDGKRTGDLFQTVSDHQRIQVFLAGSLPAGLFSILSLLVFSLVFAWESTLLFALFITGTVIQIAWILAFSRARAEVDYHRFAVASENTASLMGLFSAMPEIKLNGASSRIRRKWEAIQARTFRLGIRGMSIEQFQTYGSTTISELKNIVIMFFTASAVLRGEMTVGVMLSVQFVLGQLSQPVSDLMNFIRSRQDALLGMQRIEGIVSRDPEETEETASIRIESALADVRLDHVSFRYGGTRSPLALQDVSITFPQGCVTAIVGASGSGKTTLLKLLLRYYEPTSGDIFLGNDPMASVRHTDLRRRCGVVLQDGTIFSDTVERNIAPGDDAVDEERLRTALRIANLEPVIAGLQLGLKTVIGPDGVGLSGGQRQRILIARAIYKNPDIYLFDEATSALDAHNERVIMTNLMNELAGKTVIISAHRLSTVRRADQIFFLEKGKIVENGTHDALVETRGRYFGLIKDQLDLSG
jgi:ATP-binding cassette subfamily B protein